MWRFVDNEVLRQKYMSKAKSFATASGSRRLSPIERRSWAWLPPAQYLSSSTLLNVGFLRETCNVFNKSAFCPIDGLGLSDLCLGPIFPYSLFKMSDYFIIDFL